MLVDLRVERENSEIASAAERPLLLILAGAPGAGKSTFYESKLGEFFPVRLQTCASPLEQASVEDERTRLLKERKSFVYQTSTVDLKLVRQARSNGFEVKMIFIATEHPDLNLARILSRVSRGGVFAPVAEIQRDYEKGLQELSSLCKAVDDLILLDNTPEGHSPRVVAHFLKGSIGKVSGSIPDWTKQSFPRELEKSLEKPDRQLSR